MRTLNLVTTLLFTASLAAASLPANAQNVVQDNGPHTLDGQLRAQGYQPHPAPAGAPAEMMAPAQASAGGMIQSEGNGAIPANALSVEQYGEVTFITGGISDEETAMMKEHANEFNLHVLINSVGGAFLVAEKLHVLDGSGVEVLRIDDAGPYVYAKLKPGKYTIEANQGGEIRTSKLTVPATGAAKVQLSFK